MFVREMMHTPPGRVGSEVQTDGGAINQSCAGLGWGKTWILDSEWLG